MGPIFIIGMPRSGTKLLREILNQHESISIPRAETGFIPYFVRRRSRYGDLKNKKNFQELFAEFTQTNFWHYMEGAEEIWRESKVYDHAGTHSMADTIEAIYRVHARFEGKQIWGDKTPDYIYHTPLLKSLYPNARFVHIIRDVRDFCLSTRNAWNKSIYRAAQKWVNGIEKVRKDRSSCTDYYEIKYEDLIGNPACETQKLCEWLGVRYDSSMIDLRNTIENIGNARNKVGILKHNHNKWMLELKKDEIRKIETISGRLLKELGYDTTCSTQNRPMTKTENWIHAAYDMLNLFLFRCKAYGKVTLAVVSLARDLKMKL